MKLNSKIEKKIKTKVLEYLKKGKPGWDIPHTLASVHWMRKLIKKEGGNEKILVTSMYFHDIGYPIMKEGYRWEDVLKAKLSHPKRGAKIAKKVLEEIGGYSKKEIEEIIHLIKTHDNLKRLDTPNEILVKESDGLAQIDTDRVVGNLDKKSHEKFIKHFKEKRVPIFKTKTGKKFLKKLFV